ncbi:MAG: hypothetical protein CMI52_04180 [Parcubacteria group bacterium]|nr:hypothetical protein [Parcubacteria group bacterium]|tara:strand:- start:1186 stop:2247 length:1062 start_codon:yes stop_codon:yes gene_type:complete
MLEKSDKKYEVSSPQESSPSEYVEMRASAISREIAALEEVAVFDVDEKRLKSDCDDRIAVLSPKAGGSLSLEMQEQLRSRLVDDVMRDKEVAALRLKDLKRIHAFSQLLSEDDFLYAEQILGNKEGNLDQLLDLSGKLLHTTPDHVFNQILSAGRIVQDVDHADSGVVERGVYLTDSDSDLGLAYHVLWDDVKSPGGEKRLSSSEYHDPVQELSDKFWDSAELREKAVEYVQQRGGGTIQTKEELLKFFQNMKNGLSRNVMPSAKGVTFVFNKDSLPPLSSDGTNPLNVNWEKRLYSEDGIDLSEVTAIFVPESQIDDIGARVAGTILEGVEVRSSEELEFQRLVRGFDSGHL